MKTFNVQKRVATESTTEIYETISFDNVKDAEIKFNEILEKQDTYAGEFNNGEFSEYYMEFLEIESVDEDGDFETIKEVLVYHEGIEDKNNWKGNYACNYWAVAKHNGVDLVYNFYNNSKEMVLEYEGITDLDNWYNYKR